MLSGVSDISLPDSDAGDSALLYPSARRVDIAKLKALLDACRKASSKDFSVRLNGVPFRGHATATLNGKRYLLRRGAKRDSLVGFKDAGIPDGIAHSLGGAKLLSGGLVIICGRPGAGKTTTLGRTVVERLTRYGGVAWTLEDPVELLLEGEYEGPNGIGACYQREVPKDEIDIALQDVLRCYPADEPGILVVGEVRSRKTAMEILTAALNGLLVITTAHSRSIPGAIERLIGLAGGAEARIAMADSLRGVVHQQRVSKGGPIEFSSLFIDDAAGPVGAAIRSARPEHLGTEIQRQNNQRKFFKGQS